MLPQTQSRFTGKERDTETGLDYFGARYYGSNMGRFTSADPKPSSAKLANPQSWNRYAYADNNPLTNVDPDGKETTIFYRAPGAGGSSSKDFGHAFVYVRNSSTGKSAYFDYYPGDGGKSSIIGRVDQSRLDAHSRLTIQTTPAQEQKMLDALTAKQQNPPKYDAGAGKILTDTQSTCVSQSQDILNAGGLNFSAVTPTDLWQQAYGQFSNDALNYKDAATAGFAENPFYNPGPPAFGPGNDSPQPGQEYGRDPRGTTGQVDPNATKNEEIKRKEQQ